MKRLCATYDRCWGFNYKDLWIADERQERTPHNGWKLLKPIGFIRWLFNFLRILDVTLRVFILLTTHDVFYTFGGFGWVVRIAHIFYFLTRFCLFAWNCSQTEYVKIGWIIIDWTRHSVRSEILGSFRNRPKKSHPPLGHQEDSIEHVEHFGRWLMDRADHRFPRWCQIL